jgi:hypothetical protein
MTRISEAVECLESLGYTVTPPGAVPEIRDYKAETERLIKFAEGNGSESAATAAVATATLYLAEQQRIADLIEVGRDRDRQLDRELNDPNYHVLDGSTLKVSAPTELLDASNAIKAQIREGLGL